MTNEEILKRAIDKAIKNGWDYPQVSEYDKMIDYHYESLKHSTGTCLVINLNKKTKVENPNNGRTTMENITTVKEISETTFSHSFAKAFWGEEWVTPCGGYTKENHSEFEDRCYCSSHEEKMFKIQNWQYHLQQIVLEEDPIKYLEKFI